MKYYLYFVTEKPSGRVRICKTTRPGKKPEAIRAWQQTFNPDKLFLQKHLTREYPDAQYVKDVQKCVHDELTRKGLHIHGQWFEPEALHLLPGILSDCEK